MWVEKQDKSGFLEIHNIQSAYQWKSHFPDYTEIINHFKKAILNNEEITPSDVSEYIEDFKTENICVWNIYNVEAGKTELLGTYSSKEKIEKVLSLLKAFISKDFSQIKPSFIKGAKTLFELGQGIIGTSDCLDILKNNFVFTMPKDEDIEED